MGTEMEVCGPTPLQLDRLAMRKRAIELVNIADKVLTLAEELGVKNHEQCKFGEICQQLWRN